MSAAKQRRLHDLLDKNGEGTITAAERTSLVKLVNEAERLMVANAKRLVDFVETEEAGSPKGAVPVTVWIKPDRESLDDAG